MFVSLSSEISGREKMEMSSRSRCLQMTKQNVTKQSKQNVRKHFTQTHKNKRKSSDVSGSAQRNKNKAII